MSDTFCAKLQRQYKYNASCHFFLYSVVSKCPLRIDRLAYWMPGCTEFEISDIYMSTLNLLFYFLVRPPFPIKHVVDSFARATCRCAAACLNNMIEMKKINVNTNY